MPRVIVGIFEGAPGSASAVLKHEMADHEIVFTSAVNEVSIHVLRTMGDADRQPDVSPEF